MTPHEETEAFRVDHETAFAGQPEPVSDGITALPVERLRVRALSGNSGAIAARKEMQRRTTAQLMREMGVRG